MANFMTAINCIDGRVQEPLRRYLTQRYPEEFVDLITLPGAVMQLAENKNDSMINYVEDTLRFTIANRQTSRVAVAGHFDCLRNPVSPEVHFSQIRKAVRRVRGWVPELEVIGLWIDEKQNVVELI